MPRAWMPPPDLNVDFTDPTPEEEAAAEAAFEEMFEEACGEVAEALDLDPITFLPK